MPIECHACGHIHSLINLSSTLGGRMCVRGLTQNDICGVVLGNHPGEELMELELGMSFAHVASVANSFCP